MTQDARAHIKGGYYGACSLAHFTEQSANHDWGVRSLHTRLLIQTIIVAQIVQDKVIIWAHSLRVPQTRDRKRWATADGNDGSSRVLCTALVSRNTLNVCYVHRSPALFFKTRIATNDR